MHDVNGGGPVRRARGSRLVLLLAVLGAACDRACDPDCDPATEDCSLSTTCCTPPSAAPPAPAPLTLECSTLGGSGELEPTFRARVGGGTAPYAYVISWDDGKEDRGSTGPTTGALIEVDHEFPRPTTPEPVAYTIRATITDAARVVQTCALPHTVDAQRIDIDCTVAPRSGEPPLTVTFEARRSDCLGECEVTWTFGDGETAVGDSAVHTYREAGPPPLFTWAAGATLRDAAGRQTHCNRPIQVFPTPGPEPSPNPSPSASPSSSPTAPPGNRPPTISAYTATPPTVPPNGPSQVTATLGDPDGDPVSWTLSLDPGAPAGATIVPSSGSGNVVAAFRATGPGTAAVRLVASDGRGGSAQAALTIRVLGGEGR